MMAFLPKQHLGRKKAYFNHGYPSILDSIIMILSGEAPGWCLHLYLWLFWGGSWIFMGLALKWLMWPVLMHCFGLPGQGTKKGMLPKYGRGWEESKDFLFNDTSGKYTSAQHWQSTMSCSGQSCQKHLNCNERAAFAIELKQFDACKTSGPFILRKHIFPKEFNQNQLSVPSLKPYLGPSRNI